MLDICAALEPRQLPLRAVDRVVRIDPQDLGSLCPGLIEPPELRQIGGQPDVTLPHVWKPRRKFDTDDGDIVFSGDTARSDNLIKLARGADILVHEVIVTGWVNGLFPAPRSVAEEGLLQHLLSARTPVEEVGGIAEAAGVRTLVLSHIVPGNATREQLSPAGKGFSGELVIGRDLMQIGVGHAAASARKG